MSAFVPFGPDHLAVMAATAMSAGGILLARRRLARWDDQWLRWGVGGLLLSSEVWAWVTGWRHGSRYVPFHLCDLALVMTVIALGTLRPRVTELAYFWGLAGSVQAVLTPDLREAFPSYWWWKFFATHSGIVLAVVYLAARDRVRLSGASIWRVWGWTNVYALAAGLLNWMFGTNYGYLAHKPAHPSLLDALGSWPYYIIGMEALAFASFLLYAAPLVWGHRVKRG